MTSVTRMPRVLSHAQVRALRTLAHRAHHDGDGGHGGGGGDEIIPWAAAAILALMKRFWGAPFAVSPSMKVYRLRGASSAVPLHVDTDFVDAHGHRALYSVLVRLNDDYRGGETLFGGAPGPRWSVGDALVFKHDVPHEGRLVTRGEKLVLKTDLMFATE